MKFDDDIMALYAQAASDRGLYFDGNQIPYQTKLTPYARELRKNLTPGEKFVLGFLKSQDVKFRKQHPIDYYIVDFYLPEYSLVIEVDGEQHYTAEGKEYDTYRDEVLRLYRLDVLRISNSDIRNNPSDVAHRIRQRLHQLRQ